MFRKLNVKLSIVILFAMAVSLFASVVYAQGEEAIIEVFRLTKTHVEIKIILPGAFDPEGKYGAVIGGRHFGCEAVSADVLICIGPYRYGSNSARLSIYNKATKEVIIQQPVVSPPYAGEGEEPLLPICPPEECDPQ